MKLTGLKTMCVILLGFTLVFFSCFKETEKKSGFQPLPDSGFRAELTIKQIPAELKMGENGSAIIRVKNISDQTWPFRGDSKENYGVNLSYYLFNEAGDTPYGDGERTYLPKDLKPGESVELTAFIKAPFKPGKYQIRFEMVQEAVAWFGHKNKDNYSKPSAISINP